MRNLKFTDVGKASKIIKKLQLRATDMNTGNVEELGASLFLKLVENYALVENDFADFMAGLKGVSVAEYKEKELNEVYDDLVELSQDPGLANFISTLKKLNTSESTTSSYLNIAQ